MRGYLFSRILDISVCLKISSKTIDAYHFNLGMSLKSDFFFESEFLS
jgi:hypothetical protein